MTRVGAPPEHGADVALDRLNLEQALRDVDVANRRVIDLTHQTDVQFWCRVFDVSMDELRDAVHHAGHKVEDVERYLRDKKGTAR